MISAFESGNKTILVHFTETPVLEQKDGKRYYVAMSNAPDLAEVKNVIRKIEVYQKGNATGEVKVYELSEEEIRDIFSRVNSISVDKPAPWKINEAQDYITSIE